MLKKTNNRKKSNDVAMASYESSKEGYHSAGLLVASNEKIRG